MAKTQEHLNKFAGEGEFQSFYFFFFRFSEVGLSVTRGKCCRIAHTVLIHEGPRRKFLQRLEAEAPGGGAQSREQGR